MKFSGFISYSWAQKSLAQKLHRRLEKYKVPLELHGRSSNLGVVGKRLGTFFLDRVELSATRRLGDDIVTALEGSRYLIVLCSPNAAQSEWVLREIEVFENAGRAEDILPVLVGGEPKIFDAKTSTSGAFPKVFSRIFGEALPLAPDLRHVAERSTEDDQLAFLQIVGGLLGFGLGELSQRQLIAERRRIRYRNQIIAGLVGLLMLATAGGVTAWLQKRLADYRLSQTVASAARQVSTSATYVDRFGVPSALLQELLDQAEADFSSIIYEAGDTPQLALQRAKYNLAMAELLEQIHGNKRESNDYLRLAGSDLATARELTGRWSGRFLYYSVPDLSQIARQEARSMDFAADLAADHFLEGEATEFANRALEISQRLADADPNTQFDVVFSTCLLADTRYRLGARAEARALYDQCTTDARALWDSEPTDNNRRLLLQALTQFGVIGRLDAEFLPNAERLHQEAGILAEDFLASAPESNVARELATEAFVSLADTLSLRGAPHQMQLDAYEKAMATLEQLVAADHDRVYWQLRKADILYRMVPPQLELIGGHDAPASALRKIKEQIDFGVNLFQPMAAAEPMNAGLQRHLSALLETRAELLQLLVPHDATGDFESESRANIAAVIEIRSQLVHRHPNDLMMERDLANANLVAARIFVGLGNSMDVVMPYLTAARGRFEALAKFERFQPTINRDLAQADYIEGKLRLDAGQHSKGCALMANALGRMRRLADVAPEAGKFTAELAEFESEITPTCEDIFERD